MKALAAAGVLLTLAACSIDYGKEAGVDPDKIPLMEFNQLRQTTVRDNRVLYTLETDSSQVFQAKKEVVLKNFKFQEYDSEGKPASEGSAGSAIVNSSTNDARIVGGLKAYSKEFGVTLDISGTGALTWTNGDRILKTEPNTIVILHKDDGSSIKAHALTLDLGSNRLELEEGVQGTWTPETKSDATETTDPAADPPPVAPPQ